MTSTQHLFDAARSTGYDGIPADPEPAAPHPAATQDASAPRDPSVPHYKTLRATSRWSRPLRADIEIREFTIATGEPAKAGGDNYAATPMEVILGGLEGCLTVVVETVAAERGIPLASLTMESSAVMDIRGFEGVPNVRPFYETVDTHIRVGVPLDGAALDEFAAECERRCPALTLFRAADVAVSTHWLAVDSTGSDALEGAGR